MTDTTATPPTLSSESSFLARWWIAFLGGLLLFVALGLTAWEEAGTPNPPCTTAPVPTDAAVLYTSARTIALDGILCLAIDMQAYTAASTQPAAPALAGPPVAAPQPAYARLILYIDGLPAPTSPVYAPIPSGTGPDWHWLRFALQSDSDATSDDAAAWRDILSGPSHQGGRTVAVGVGNFGDTTPVPRAVLSAPLRLQLYTPWHAATTAAGMLLLFGGLVRGGWNGGLLRDPGGAFSLSRSQTLFWLALSFGGYLYIWLVSGQWDDVMTSNVLTLIGIAGVAGISARVIDQQGAQPQPSSGHYFADILSDGTSGLSIHRIQLLLWNIVLGAIFVWTAWYQFSFPEFDTNLLILAGLVNATYLGFKLPENKAAIAAAASAQPAT